MKINLQSIKCFFGFHDFKIVNSTKYKHSDSPELASMFILNELECKYCGDKKETKEFIWS